MRDSDAIRAAVKVGLSTRAVVLLVAVFAALSFGPASGGLARENAESLRITGHERFDIVGIERIEPGGQLELRIVDEAGAARPMHARVRIDTPDELAYYRNGGILPYVLRQLLAS